jgi:hypothetical protein
VLMGAAAGVLAAGVLVEKVDVRCLSIPTNGVCPPEDVAGEQKRKPFLGPSVGVAAALSIFGAIDAYLAARRANERAVREAGDAAGERGARLERPALVPTPDALRLELLRIRF